MAFLPFLIAILLFWAARPQPAEDHIQAMLRSAHGSFHLPTGTLELTRGLVLPDGTHDLDISGNGTTLRASPHFHGHALLACRACRDVTIHNLSIDGNRPAIHRPLSLPSSNQTFASSFDNNGLLFVGGDTLTVSSVHFTNIPAFALLANASTNVLLRDLTVDSSGGLNSLGRNNSTGGVLLEEGVTHWQIVDSLFRDISGNAVWTHSRSNSPRAAHGLIARNRFDNIGRDAIQIGHATDVQVIANTGSRIGWPISEIDVESRAVPVAIDTSGNVDRTTYRDNRFEEVDGKCIDLDGFHDGSVLHNSCLNRGSAADYPWGQFGIVMNNSAPEMQSRNIAIIGNTIDGANYGGIFIIGSGHRIAANELRRLNLAHCDDSKPACQIPGQPHLLDSGIYLAAGAARPAPAVENQIERNSISGFRMRAHCFGYAPGISAAKNSIEGNRCADE